MTLQPELAPERMETRRPGVPPAHLPALDGLRAVAVLLVVFCHMAPADDFGPYTSLMRAVQGVGGAYVGVDLFFVLSGFLITRILVAEQAERGQISFRRFYIKRVLRIFPIYYLTLAICAGAGAMSGGEVASVASYTFNYFYAATGSHNPLEHTWSLSVEEQFYLVWPWLVAAIPARLGRRITGVVVPALSLAAAALIAARYPHDDVLAGNLIYMSTATRMVSLSLGGWLAYREFDVLRAEPATIAAEGSSRWAAMMAAGAILLLADKMARGGALVPTHGVYWLIALFGYAILCAGAVGLLVFAADRLASWLRRALSIAPARGIGRISYGIYLYHIPILFALGFSPSVSVTNPTHISNMIFAAGLIAAVATASWFFIERPILALKSRLKPAPAGGLSGGARAWRRSAFLTPSPTSPMMSKLGVTEPRG